MNRLTKIKNHYGDYTINEEAFSLGEDEYQCCINVLGCYEDIEEEIGVDLFTLNKLRKADKIYVKFFEEIQEWNKTKVDLRYCKIWYGYNAGKGYGLSQPLSNYGKGFALTREELEKCQK